MNTYDTHCHVLIVAAGIGARFNSQSDVPKQYHKIANKTVLAHSIEAFNKIHCQRIMVCTHADDCWWPGLHFQSPHKVHQCTGGSSRRQSVINGLLALRENQAQDRDWVLVHDAARPCVTTSDLTHLIEQSQQHPTGGMLVKPISDTIKHSTDGQHSHKTIDREQLFAALTPQMFRLGDLLQYLEQADPAKTTDEASSFEQAGQAPLMVQGAAQNIKITYPDDLDLAAFYLKQQGRC